jgi:uncharacterized protein YjbI with pentapeptide repeats
MVSETEIPVVRFDLRGQTVGARTAKAIERASRSSKIALDCRKARFIGALNLKGAVFAQADFSGARFPHGLRLSRVLFEGDLALDRAEGSDLFLLDATVEGTAGLREIVFANLQVRDASFRRYASFDDAELGFATMRDVSFGMEARFRDLTSKGPVTLRSLRFGGAATLDRLSASDLSCQDCSFEGPLEAARVRPRRTLTFDRCRFHDTRALELRAGEQVRLRGSSFSESVSLRVKSPVLYTAASSFDQGADIHLRPGSFADFARTSFQGPSLIATAPGKGAPARIAPLDGTRIERLALQGLDLSQCAFGRLHHLEGLLISGRGQLGLAPPVVEGSYQREVLADEVLRRSGRSSRMLAWAPVIWRPPAALKARPAANPAAIADLYRALRKAREDSGDYPGAADFYYGEMEMRREGAGTWVERVLLTGYWALSGYGMRAARTLVFFALLVLLISAGMQTSGLEDPPSYWHTVAWTTTDSISLVRPIEHLGLTPVGMYLSFLIRLVGPALIALMAFALRSRVRR